MAKYYGRIGFVQTTNEGNARGVYTNDLVVEREYAGDVLQSARSWNNSETLNDNLTINVRISIVADDYASVNLPNVKYAYWRGNRFEVTNADDSQYPRLVLTLGGVYNG